MQEIYGDPRRGTTPVSDPTSGTVRRTAVRRGTAAESAGREFQQMRELPWVYVR